MKKDLFHEGLEGARKYLIKSGTNENGLEQESLDQAFRDFVGSGVALLCAVKSGGSEEAVKHMKMALLHTLVEIAQCSEAPYQIDEILELFGEERHG